MESFRAAHRPSQEGHEQEECLPRLPGYQMEYFYISHHRACSGPGGHLTSNQAAFYLKLKTRLRRTVLMS